MVFIYLVWHFLCYCPFPLPGYVFFIVPLLQNSSVIFFSLYLFPYIFFPNLLDGITPFLSIYIFLSVIFIYIYTYIYIYIYIYLYIFPLVFIFFVFLHCVVVVESTTVRGVIIITIWGGGGDGLRATWDLFLELCFEHFWNVLK